MVGAEPHGGVDRLDIPDALIERVHGLVDHREQNAVDDERRKILGVGCGFSDFLHNI